MAQQIGFKKMNWMPKASAWNEHIQKLTKRRTMMRAFENQNNTLINAFATISNFQITAHVDNVARTAADRIIAEGKKKVDEQANKLMAGVDKKA